MVRVLHVVYDLRFGGIESLLLNLYRHMDRNKVQFDFLYCPVNGPGNYEDEIKSLGGHVYHAPRVRDSPKAYFSYLDDVLAGSPDCRIVHVHNLDPKANFSMRWAKDRGLYVIAHSHNVREQSTDQPAVTIKRAFRLMFRGVPDHFFACSVEAGRYAFGEKIVRSNKFQVLPNGIDLSLYEGSSERHDKFKESLFPGLKGPLLLNTGRLAPQKNQTFLLDIFNEIIRKEPCSQLAIAGEGSLLPDLKEKASELGILDRVVFLGGVENVPDYLSAADVFVFPSLFEGLGISALEAQAAGLPTIMSDTVPERTCCTHLGVRVPLDASPTVWADVVLDALRRNEAGRHDALDEVRAAGFDIEDVASRLQDFYLQKAAKVVQKER